MNDGKTQVRAEYIKTRVSYVNGAKLQKNFKLTSTEREKFPNNEKNIYLFLTFQNN